MENTVKIPTFLHEVHGKQSNWYDIITTHVLALLTVGAIVFLASDLDLAPWKKWVLIALAYDLGGGVLANFTYATKQFYRVEKRRIVFLSIHFLQPLFMCLVFPEHLVGIAIFSSFTVFSSFMINAIKNPKKQLATGAFTALSGIIALYIVPFEWNLPLLLLLILFLLKLPLSFSVRWYSLNKN
ncbi:MAG: hypothetical protein AAF990_27830 [Bacteroidota bacterium]